MVEVEEVEVQNLEYQRIEEVFEDKDSNIFDTILFNGPIDSVKTKLKLLKYKGTEVHGIFSYFHRCRLRWSVLYFGRNKEL